MAAKKKTEAKPAGLKKGDHLYLIDGSGYLFRAYFQAAHQDKKYLFRADGLPTGAIRMFCDMLWKLLEDTKAGDKPTHLAVIFDAGRKTFRNEIYSDYKANRPEPPDDLIPQFPLVKEATRAFGVPAIEMPGYEADDLIATYARLAREKGVKVTIVSSDKDLMQLVVDGQIEMLDTMKSRRIATAEVIEKFGVPPSKVIAVQALAGDSQRQYSGRPRHRREDRGRTHWHIRRSGHAFKARQRNQAAQTARVSDGERGQNPPLGKTGDAG